MAFDLHTHSRSSDGLLTPLQLVARAKTVGLAGLALTDHDTVDGIPQFLQAGKKLGLLCLPGVELSTVYQGVECHILGYRIDHRHRGLLARLGQVIRARKTRAEQILALLAQHGLRLSWSELKREAPGDYVGSFHIYRALKAKGLIGEDRTEEAYDYYFGPQGLASVPHSDIVGKDCADQSSRRRTGAGPSGSHRGLWSHQGVSAEGLGDRSIPSRIIRRS